MAASSRTSRLFSKFRLKKFELPEKYKGGRIEKMYDYLYTMYNDYKMVAIECKDDMRGNPFKTACYLTGVAGLVTLIKTNPDEQSFRDGLLRNKLELLLIGEPIRNPKSDEFAQNALRLYDHEKIRRFNLGVASVIYHADHSKHVDLYEARCEPLKRKWLDYKDSVIDVGIFGRWIWLHETMKDFDINPNE
ncbi:mitochondrial import inner membrane translocase subunit Tim29-like [Tubulanus polymorphus]|uniref:mitochondrial import inner membrane translocase subunit Tim29-like n=1 Tax=Tubulanus polymorphus TaxID=672921 RepID=UPI003DA685FC